MRAADVHVEDTPNGNVRIIVPDNDSDSLAVIALSRFHGTLSAKVGLRGNYDAKGRPIRYTYATMPAPDVTPAEREARKARWFKHNSWRFL